MKTSVTDPIKIIFASLAALFPWQGGEAQELASELRALQPIEIAYPSYGVEVGAGWDALGSGFITSRSRQQRVRWLRGRPWDSGHSVSPRVANP